MAQRVRPRDSPLRHPAAGHGHIPHLPGLHSIIATPALLSRERARKLPRLRYR